MIAVDTQILVYAHRPESVWHERARRQLGTLASGGTRWGIPLHCLIEFYATVTRSYRPPSTIAQAIDQIDAWLESPMVIVLSEDVQTWKVTRDLLIAGRIISSAAYDARIAAVCLQHGVNELWSSDRDYVRFPALRVRNPLIEPTGAAEPRARYRTSTPPGKVPAKSKRGDKSRRASP